MGPPEECDEPPAGKWKHFASVRAAAGDEKRLFALSEFAADPAGQPGEQLLQMARFLFRLVSEQIMEKHQQSMGEGETVMSEDKFAGLGRVGENFLRLAKQPENIGSIENSNGKANAVGQCGDSVEVFLAVTDEKISDIKVAPQGCVYTWVCASAMSELAKGRHLDEALRIEPDQIAEILGGLPEDHLHCARLAVNTLGEAIADFYKKSR
jgi:nitrogen fixation NifU-like protein